MINGGDVVNGRVVGGRGGGGVEVGVGVVGWAWPTWASANPTGEEGNSIKEKPTSRVSDFTLPSEEVPSGVLAPPTEEARVTRGRRAGRRVREFEKKGPPASGKGIHKDLKMKSAKVGWKIFRKKRVIVMKNGDPGVRVAKAPIANFIGDLPVEDTFPAKGVVDKKIVKTFPLGWAILLNVVGGHEGEGVGVSQHRGHVVVGR